jgi:hypothetical protein
MEFIDTIHTLRAGPRDILVSFDVVYVFTMVPIEETLRLLAGTLMRRSYDCSAMS